MENGSKVVLHTMPLSLLLIINTINYYSTFFYVGFGTFLDKFLFS